MRLLEPLYSREDERGFLKELTRSKWLQANHLFIKKGSSFGGHYHMKKKELFYLVSGEIDLEGINDKGGFRINMQPGSLVLIEPFDLHTAIALEDSNIIEFMSEHYSESDCYETFDNSPPSQGEKP